MVYEESRHRDAILWRPDRRRDCGRVEGVARYRVARLAAGEGLAATRVARTCRLIRAADRRRPPDYCLSANHDPVVLGFQVDRSACGGRRDVPARYRRALPRRSRRCASASRRQRVPNLGVIDGVRITFASGRGSDSRGHIWFPSRCTHLDVISWDRSSLLQLLGRRTLQCRALRRPSASWSESKCSSAIHARVIDIVGDLLERCAVQAHLAALGFSTVMECPTGAVDAPQDQAALLLRSA